MLGVDGVEDVKEILPRGTFVGRISVREERHHVGVLLELGVDGLDRELVVLGHLDGFDVGLAHQLLLAGEHRLQEVLVDGALLRQVELEPGSQQ